MDCHYFLACYWGNDPLRRSLCQDFCNRYPIVHLLQRDNQIRSVNTTVYEVTNDDLSEGTFIDYKMINRWLKVMSKGKRKIRSLTLLDTDLLLDPNIFKSIIEKHEAYKDKNPYFLSYKKGYELVDGRLYEGPNSMIYNRIRGIEGGHTGFMLSFNNHFLDAYNFSEKFIYGGYDFFLTCAILGKCMNQFKDEFFKVPISDNHYIDTNIIHNYHGSKLDRMTPWDRY